MPEQAELQRKTGQRGLLIASYKRFNKDSDRVITPVMEAVSVPAHLALTRVPASQAAVPLSHSTFTGAELPQAKKKKYCIYARKVNSAMSDSLSPCRLWSARLFSQRMGSPGKNTGAYWPILVAIPF